MADFIILTTAQASAVRGVTSPGHALDPRELADGNWALPVRVLDDVKHNARRATLLARARRAINSDADWKSTV